MTTAAAIFTLIVLAAIVGLIAAALTWHQTYLRALAQIDLTKARRRHAATLEEIGQYITAQHKAIRVYLAKRRDMQNKVTRAITSVPTKHTPPPLNILKTYIANELELDRLLAGLTPAARDKK